MSQSLRLHYAPDNASLCVRLALEEIGLPYETALVDRKTGAQNSPAHLALNPNGLIPVLETTQGPLFETGAILIWLGDHTGDLVPPPRNPARQFALQWVVWLANTLHPALRMLFYPEKYSDGDPEALRQVTRKRILGCLALLENAPHCDWLDSGEPTAMGCYLAPMLRWPALYGGATEWYDLSTCPRLMAFAQRIEQRPAAQRAAAAEGLGATPFSRPAPCNPPEGHAI